MQPHKQPLDYSDYLDVDDPDEDEDSMDWGLIFLFVFMAIAYVLFVRPYEMVLGTFRQVRTCTQWSPNHQ